MRQGIRRPRGERHQGGAPEGGPDPALRAFSRRPAQHRVRRPVHIPQRQQTRRRTGPDFCPGQGETGPAAGFRGRVRNRSLEASRHRAGVELRESGSRASRPGSYLHNPVRPDRAVPGLQRTGPGHLPHGRAWIRDTVVLGDRPGERVPVAGRWVPIRVPGRAGQRLWPR